MVCKEIQAACAEKWGISTWKPIERAKNTHLSFSKQIPESRNSVMIWSHFLCYGPPDNSVKTIVSGYLSIEFQIFNSPINVFPEWILIFPYNITSLKLRNNIIQKAQVHSLFTTRGSDLEHGTGNLSWKDTVSMEERYPGYSQKQRTGQISCGASLYYDFWVQRRLTYLKMWKQERVSRRLWGNLPHPWILLL